MQGFLAIWETITRELAWFSAIGFLAFGIDEVCVDLLWLARAGFRRFFVFRHRSVAIVESLSPPAMPGKLAVFIPAWSEHRVIAPMLRNAIRAYGDADFEIFVGCYPNDFPTLAAVDSVPDPRIRKVVGQFPGPTTKGDCLNTLWHALCENPGIDGVPFKGVVLHDAEDLVDPSELPVCAWMLDHFELVQLPVIALADRGSRMISGHYCDEFAEAHSKTLLVREMLGAAVPSAGVGCAVRIETLRALAEEHGGLPFDTQTLTEDYELGLNFRERGWRTAFVSIFAAESGNLVATRAHFPTTVEAAVRQKTRWMIGISLAGWDRLGWGRGFGENWMRLRDRRAVIAAILLLSGYMALACFSLGLAVSAFSGIAFSPFTAPLEQLLTITLALLVWRLAVRAYFVGRLYGSGEAALSIARVPIANFIAIMAAKRAVSQYLAMRSGADLVWDKTDHQFPDWTEKGP